MLADYVDEIADWEISCPDQAEALTLKVIPTTAPALVIHYRTPFTLTWQFGSPESPAFGQPEYRHYATVYRTGVVVARPRGPLGLICVRLRPDGAAWLLGDRMQDFLDARISLDDLFGSSRVSLLVEMLAEARTSAGRFACMERFLAANLRNAALTRWHAELRPS